MELRILNAQEVRPAPPMAAAMAAVKQALAQLSRSRADVPLLTRLGLAGRKAVVLFMPAYLQKTGDMAFKIVSAFPQNPSRGLPTSHALVVVPDAQTGRPLALLEGATPTAMRTGAPDGAPTDGLARLEPSIAAAFGNGVQARPHLPRADDAIQFGGQRGLGCGRSSAGPGQGCSTRAGPRG